MAQGWWRGVLDTLTARAVRERLDKRRLQAEIDIHRLYLLTAFRERFAAGEHHDARHLVIDCNHVRRTAGMVQCPTCHA